MDIYLASANKCSFWRALAGVLHIPLLELNRRLSSPSSFFLFLSSLFLYSPCLAHPLLIPCVHFPVLSLFASPIFSCFSSSPLLSLFSSPLSSFFPWLRPPLPLLWGVWVAVLVLIRSHSVQHADHSPSPAPSPWLLAVLIHSRFSPLLPWSVSCGCVWSHHGTNEALRFTAHGGKAGS